MAMTSELVDCWGPTLVFLPTTLSDCEHEVLSEGAASEEEETDDGNDEQIGGLLGSRSGLFAHNTF